MTKGREGTVGKDSFIARLFPERVLLVRQKGTVRSIRCSTFFQTCCAVFFFTVSVWLLSVSAFFFRYDKVLNQKETEISSSQKAYRDLLEEVAAYREHIGTVSAKLEENLAVTFQKQQELLQLNGEQPDFVQKKQDAIKRDFTRLEQERQRLEQEIMHVSGQLSVLADKKASMERENLDFIEISLRQAVLQRDLATSESEELKERIGELENLVAEMQDTQIMVFQKMGVLTDGGINAIEKNLSDVGQTLAKAGLNMDSLLYRIRRENQKTAVGGPYIPVSSLPNLKHKELNISLVSLNRRLDRWYDLTALQEALPLGKPLDHIRVTSPFGAREDPFQGAPARHEAVDLGGMTGLPVYATAPGKVSRAGRWGWYGNIVEIDHGLGFKTRYAHMDKIFVQKGDTVRSGDKIGHVGSTGRSTGPHLHYEVRVRGVPMDPIQFIKAKKDVFKN